MDRNDEARLLALTTLAKAPAASELASPLDYILADHFRLRTLCGMADRSAASDRRDEACIVAVTRFLQEDFGAHIIDEDEDLFPLLRRRAAPEDGIEAVLCDLSEEHASDRLDATEIIEGLSVNRNGPRPTESLRDLLHRFADNERHHLIVENAIVLPLARVRLTVDDLRNLGRRMASRRGVDFPDKSG